MRSATRRQFLGQFGHGFLFATAGLSLDRLPFFRSAPELGDRVWRDDLETLVEQIRVSTPDALLPQLVAALRAGTSLDRLVVAGALANARTFGGTDYEGYHAFMALLPSLGMSRSLPAKDAPLPVLKVLYRTSARIRATGGPRITMPPIAPAAGVAADAAAPATAATGSDVALALRSHARARELGEAERLLALRCAAEPAGANADLQPLVEDDLNVHRIVLAMRAWDTARLAGDEHAATFLRQVVRFCVDEEKGRVGKGDPEPAVRTIVPSLLDEHGLRTRAPGTGALDDAAFARLVDVVFGESREAAAAAVAKALAQGTAPEAVGEAISVAANRLLLHDTGKKRVHGASVGVHASDAANAWRNVARIASPRTQHASLVVGAFHTAGQSPSVGKEPFDFAAAAAKLRDASPARLLEATKAAVEQRDQHGACAAAARYGELGADPQPMFDLLLRYALSEDGALHAEKYWFTVREEHDRTRASHRWRHVVALARVTASEFGEPAPGLADARQLLA